jgi:HAD superfamily hydrolase (TIGR01509 family)
VRHRERILAERVLPGVERTIDAAVAAGLLLGVASSSSAEWVGSHLARLGLLDHFAELACRTADVPPKPAPDLYLAAVGALGVAPHEAIAFEDSPNGVAAAKAAGLWCVAVPNGMTRGMDLGAADLVVASFEDVELARLLVLAS